MAPRVTSMVSSKATSLLQKHPVCPTRNSGSSSQQACCRLEEACDHWWPSCSVNNGHAPKARCQVALASVQQVCTAEVLEHILIAAYSFQTGLPGSSGDVVQSDEAETYLLQLFTFPLRTWPGKGLKLRSSNLTSYNAEPSPGATLPPLTSRMFQIATAEQAHFTTQVCLCWHADSCVSSDCLPAKPISGSTLS